MTLLEVLRKGRARIRRGWCQGVLARDREGWAESPTSMKAVAWCIRGAILTESAAEMAAADMALSVALRRGDPAVDRRLAVEELVAYNNARGRRKIDVLRLFDRAIATVRKQR